MLGVLVGTENPADFADIDWSIADSIRTIVNFSDEEIEYTIPIQAVPYALQAAKSKLTTDQIVAYLSDPETTIEDYATIMEALGLNEDSDGELWNMIKHKVVNYLKHRKDKAVDITAYYLVHATPEDVTELYNEIKDRKDIMDKAVSLMYDYAIANREYVMQLIPSYVKKLDAAEDVAPLIHTAIQQINALNDEDREDLENAMLPHLVKFAKSHRELAVNTAKYFMASANANQTQQLLNTFIGSNMEKVFVYDKFFHYLDYYFQANGLNAIIQQQVDNELAPAYLPKQACPIDPCAD